ncbi:Rho guanine nucleotide exchange factor [Marasmius tenuissimus]|uniref:Rho guanine nucleotide exchange factor n=1 Tax=Marasmius tenuissimus TaxID=585030 RepID=A0ABR2ZJE6_9AGAR
MSLEPSLKRLEDHLTGIFSDKLRLQGFLEMKGYEAQTWLDSMQQNVKRLGDFPIAAGGFGDVWKGVIGESIEHVCLKVVKVYLESDLEKLTKEYLREAIFWRQMKHPNILPFLGIYRLESTQQLCLISPWMNKGNLVQFLKASKREDIDHYTLVHDIAAGLAHLHVMKLVHSDLKGVNILITDSLRACIGDFGLSRISDTRGLSITTTSRPRGTGRWLAPELLEGSLASKESDIFALALGTHSDGDNTIIGAPSTTPVDFHRATPDSLPPHTDFNHSEPEPRTSLFNENNSIPAGRSSSQKQQHHEALIIEVTDATSATSPDGSPRSHDPPSFPPSPVVRNSPSAPLVYEDNDPQPAIEAGGASGSRSPVEPLVPKLEKEEASVPWHADANAALPTFDRLVSENHPKHIEVIQAISRVKHAPEALAAQQATIMDLQFRIEESMLNLIKLSEKITRQKNVPESVDKPKAKFWSVMRSLSLKNGEAQKRKDSEADVTYLTAVEEEARERERHEKLKEALTRAKIEERALGKQVREYALMTNKLDAIYNAIFGGFTGFPEENQLQQQVVTAKAMYDRVEATFSAETQAYERLYRAEKALHDCLEKLKEAVRCATSPSLTSGTMHKRETACLRDAHTSASQVPSLVQEARQLSPSVKPLGALAISQRIPTRIPSESRERFNASLDDATSEVVRAYTQASTLDLVAAECSTYSGRTAGAQSVLENTAQTLSRYEDELRATRKRIFDGAAARSPSDEHLVPPPPSYQE